MNVANTDIPPQSPGTVSRVGKSEGPVFLPILENTRGKGMVAKIILNLSSFSMAFPTPHQFPLLFLSWQGSLFVSKPLRTQGLQLPSPTPTWPIFRYVLAPGRPVFRPFQLIELDQPRACPSRCSASVCSRIGADGIAAVGELLVHLLGDLLAF